MAALTTVYHHNSHADVLLSRLLQGENLDHISRKPELELARLYVDQFPTTDLSGKFAADYGFRLCATADEALAPEPGEPPLDGILIVGEHGDYPQNEKGQDLYPRKRFFDSAMASIRRSGRPIPVFMDKHLSHSWAEARAMFEEARRMKVPLMAGSSLPTTWRRPAIEVPRGARLKEAVAVSYHTLYGYGFHALEMLQSLAERRRGGETGIREAQCLEGKTVWAAGREGRYDRSLLDLALSRLPGSLPAKIEEAVPNPVLFLLDYADGFRASVFTLNPAVGGWAVAWRQEDRKEPFATHFWTQEARPLGHFTFLMRRIERMILTRKAPQPAERTLLTSGAMDFLLTSKARGGVPIATPELAIRYQPGPAWRDPGPPPPPRPLDQQ